MAVTKKEDQKVKVYLDNSAEDLLESIKETFKDSDITKTVNTDRKKYEGKKEFKKY